MIIIKILAAHVPGTVISSKDWLKIVYCLLSLFLKFLKSAWSKQVAIPVFRFTNTSSTMRRRRQRPSLMAVTAPRSQNIESRRFEDEEAALDVDNDVTTPAADVLRENKTVTMPRGQFRLKFDPDSFRDAFLSRSTILRPWPHELPLRFQVAINVRRKQMMFALMLAKLSGRTRVICSCA